MNGVPALRPQFPSYGNVLARGTAIKGQEARNVLMQQQIQDYPEERNWLKEQRGMARQKMVWAEEDRAGAKKKRLEDYKLQLKQMKGVDLDNERKMTEIISDQFAKVTDIQDYIPFVKYMTTEGGFKWPVDPKMFRDHSDFINPDGTPNEQAFDEYRDSFVMEAKDRVAANLAEAKKKKIKPTLIGERQALMEDGKIIAKGAKWGKPKEFKPDTDKPEVKESIAIDKIVNIRKAIAKFDETGLIDAWIMKNEPDLAQTLNKPQALKIRKMQCESRKLITWVFYQMRIRRYLEMIMIL